MFNITIILTTQWKHIREPDFDNLKILGFDFVGKRKGLSIFAGLLGFTLHMHINLGGGKKTLTFKSH